MGELCAYWTRGLCWALRLLLLRLVLWAGEEDYGDFVVVLSRSDPQWGVDIWEDPAERFVRCGWALQHPGSGMPLAGDLLLVLSGGEECCESGAAG